MIQYKKLMMTLALLLTAATGAWAQEVEQSESFTTNTAATVYTGNNFKITVVNSGDEAGFVVGVNMYATIEALNGETITKVEFTKGFMNINNFSCEVGTTNISGDVATVSGVNQTSLSISATKPLQIIAVKVYFITAPTPLTVAWDAATKTGTFTQPGFDVVLTPLYAPTAQWAIESDVELLPTAAEGVIAGTDAPLIVEGTVATGQGTVMYFATTEQLTAEQAAQANGWLSTLPTAEGYDDATTVYVWYYIQGADTPDGQEATAENTFNDSEICAQPIEVSVLSNKFDITFKAANANTIQDGKATVKVGTEQKTLDEEGKLKQVQMGQTVTIEAAQGYKFRKVEVKKTEAPATPEGPTLAQTLTTANMTVKVYYIYTDMNNTCEFLSNGDGTYTFQSGTGLVGGNNQKAKALVVENGKLVFKQNFYETLVKLWNQVGFSVTFDTSENTYSIWKGSNETINATLSKVEVNGTQIALTQQ